MALTGAYSRSLPTNPERGYACTHACKHVMNEFSTRFTFSPGHLSLAAAVPSQLQEICMINYVDGCVREPGLVGVHDDVPDAYRVRGLAFLEFVGKMVRVMGTFTTEA